MRSIFLVTALFIGSLSQTAVAQSPLEPTPFPGGAVPDHLKTMVIGTRFVRTEQDNISPGRRFNKFRVPLAEFNQTDHCVDQGSLEIAESYFRTLGRMLEKTGYYYRIPTEDADRVVSSCEARHGEPPRALAQTGTQILAFGRVVPTKVAPALEETLR